LSRILRKEAFYPNVDPQQVWVALTDPRAIAEWLMPNTFRAELGAKFVFQVDPMPGCNTITECEVLELDPPKKLVYSWHPLPNKSAGNRQGKSIVSWTLTPEGNGTRLVLEHIGFEVIPFIQRLGMAFGWGTMVKRWIPKVAANATSDGAFQPGAIPLAKRCYKHKNLPDHIVR
jgi:uncharacterized protein YndB with AHSA1/START domain